MDLSKIEKSLDKIEPGLKKYEHIMNRLHETDVSKDIEFQRMFNGFYKIRRNQEFRNEYYQFLERNKTNVLSFDTVIKHLYNKLQRIEPSFSSKMVATINPSFPVWDEYVLKNLGLKKTYSGSKNRIDKTIDLYNIIVKWYVDFLPTDDAKKMIILFNERYKCANITDTKKIDLILWQMRG